MTDPIEDGKNTFIKAEPVMAAHLSAAVVGFVVTLLVTRGVITTTQASTLTQELLPVATAGALALLGLVVRNFVTPAAKLAEKVEQGVEARLNPAGPKHAAAVVPPSTIAIPEPLSAADQLAISQAIHPS